MERSIALGVSALLAQDGFSLDELVIKAKELFERKGIAGFLQVLLELLDADLCSRLVRAESAWHPNPCCPKPTYVVHSLVARRLRTSAGTIHLTWRRLQCSNCRRSCIPLREFLGLNHYQSMTSELEQIVTEVVSEQNYRRASRHLDRIGMIPVPKSTAQRWVTLSDCDRLEPHGKQVDNLLVDSTGYKRRPDPEVKRDNQGEVRVALGVKRDGTIVPLGVWSGISWEAIGQAIQVPGPETQPIAGVLVSDGEPGLAEGLAHLAHEQQRCHWHEVHDLDQFLRTDQAPIPERRSLQAELAGILGIELPAEDFQLVKAEDKVELAQTVAAAEQRLDELVEQLVTKGYGRAARYIGYARDRLFTYVKVWLACGLVAYRVTSLIERMMREIGRRLKRIAFGWSEAGAAQMARIIIKRITSGGEWLSYWEKRLRITGRVTLTYLGAQAT